MLSPSGTATHSEPPLWVGDIFQCSLTRYRGRSRSLPCSTTTTPILAQRQSVMVNYRVDNLDAMVARLTSMGAVVEDILVEENGRFTWSTDLEGNRFELWEPGPLD